MKRLFPLLLALVLLTAAMPAAAFQTRAEDPAQHTLLQVMGQAFLPAASKFDCPVFSAANYSDPQNRSALLEYLPEGQSLANWARMVSVSVYNLEEEPAHQKMTMIALSGALQKAFSEHGKVLQNQHYANAAGEPGMFIEFEIGEGDKREHNAGVFMRTSKRAAAFIQVQSRGKALSQEDVLTIHKMITPNPKEAPVDAGAPKMPEPFALPTATLGGLNTPEPVVPAPDVAEPDMQEDIAPGLWEGEPAWRLEQEQGKSGQTQGQAPSSSPAGKSWLDQH